MCTMPNSIVKDHLVVYHDSSSAVPSKTIHDEAILFHYLISFLFFVP